MHQLKIALLAILAVFAPAQAMVLTSMSLVLVDLCTGLLAARHRKDKITSSGLRRTVIKLFIYEAAILLAFLTQTYLTGPGIPVSNIVAGFIGITELLSCMENMNEISGNKLLQTLIDKLNHTKP